MAVGDVLLDTCLVDGPVELVLHDWFRIGFGVSLLLVRCTGQLLVPGDCIVCLLTREVSERPSYF
jgi:hypothetical protein